METKMKTALLIIPATNGTIDRHRYLTDCIAMTMKEGYMPFLYDLIDNYTSVNYSDYIKKTLPLSDVVFLFEDFGKGENLIQLVENTDKTKYIYKKIPAAWNTCNLEMGYWGPSYLAALCKMRPATISRYLRAFYCAGLRKVRYGGDMIELPYKQRKPCPKIHR